MEAVLPASAAAEVLPQPPLPDALLPVLLT